eukprot:Gb_06534 [translate_table: standard]
MQLWIQLEVSFAPWVTFKDACLPWYLATTCHHYDSQGGWVFGQCFVPRRLHSAWEFDLMTDSMLSGLFTRNTCSEVPREEAPIQIDKDLKPFNPMLVHQARVWGLIFEPSTSLSKKLTASETATARADSSQEHSFRYCCNFEGDSETATSPVCQLVCCCSDITNGRSDVFCLAVEDLSQPACLKFSKKNNGMVISRVITNARMCSTLPSSVIEYSAMFYRVEGHGVSSSIQGVASSASAGLLGATSADSSLPDTYRPPPRPLPYDADPRYSSLRRDGLVSRREKTCSHLHEESEPLRRSNSDGCDEPLTTLQKRNGADYEEQGQGYCPETSEKRQLSKSMTGVESAISLIEDEDVCPTCLDGIVHCLRSCSSSYSLM